MRLSNEFYEKSVKDFSVKYLDFYKDRDSDTHELKEIKRNFKDAIIQTITITKKQGIIRQFVDFMNNVKMQALQRLEVSLRDILVQYVEEQVAFITKTIQDEKNELKHFFDLNFRVYPKFVFSFESKDLVAAIKDSWDTKTNKELENLCSRFKEFCDKLLERFEENNAHLYIPTKENELLRKSFSEIVVATLPSKFTQDNPLLIKILDSLQVTESDKQLLM